MCLVNASCSVWSRTHHFSKLWCTGYASVLRKLTTYWGADRSALAARQHGVGSGHRGSQAPLEGFGDQAESWSFLGWVGGNPRKKGTQFSPSGCVPPSWVHSWDTGWWPSSMAGYLGRCWWLLSGMFPFGQWIFGNLPPGRLPASTDNIPSCAEKWESLVEMWWRETGLKFIPVFSEGTQNGQKHTMI